MFLCHLQILPVGDLRPQAKHLQSRAEYLLKVLRRQTSADAKTTSVRVCHVLVAWCACVVQCFLPCVVCSVTCLRGVKGFCSPDNIVSSASLSAFCHLLKTFCLVFYFLIWSFNCFSLVCNLWHSSSPTSSHIYLGHHKKLLLHYITIVLAFCILLFSLVLVFYHRLCHCLVLGFYALPVWLETYCHRVICWFFWNARLMQWIVNEWMTRLGNIVFEIT